MTGDRPSEPRLLRSSLAVVRDCRRPCALVAHAHPLVAEGIASVIARSHVFQSVVSCTDPVELVWAADGPPDVLLVDEASARRLAMASPQAPHDIAPQLALVLLASAIDDELVRLAVDLSADSVLLASLSIEDVIAALGHIARGHGVFPAGWSRMLSETSGDHRAEGLTPREREVLELVGAGLSNREIADQLCLSVHTVKFHLRGTYAKLAVRNRVEAVGLLARGQDLSVRSIPPHAPGATCPTG